MTRMCAIGGKRRAASLGLTIVLMAGPPGCSENKYDDLQAFVQAHDHDVASAVYRIEPPDVITISSPNVPEVDGETQRVGSEGKISLKLLGEVKVSELSPKELAAKLEDLLSRYYEDPTVNARVMGYASKRVYVFGEVVNPGPMAFTGRNTVLSILAVAQPTFLAWGERVRVIRPSAADQERRKVTVDVDKMIKSGDLRGNMLLQNGDIVYVPPTPLAWLGLRMRELLFPFGPVLNTYQTPSQFIEAYDTYDHRLGRDQK